MAFGMAFNSQMNMMNQVRNGQCSTPPTPKSGTLFVADNFYDDGGSQLPHGDVVTLSAQRDGFRGSVVPTVMQMSTKSIDRMDAGSKPLFETNRTPAETQKAIQEYSKGRALNLIEGATSTIDGVTATGAKNSAVNLSQGNSTARITQTLYGTAADAWGKDVPEHIRENAEVVAKNYAKAYGLDFNKLISSDAKVSGAERAKLQKALIGTVDKSLHGDKEISAAQANLRTSVLRCEANRNSVVVSSGNDNEVIQQFRKDANGVSFGQAPSKFTENLIATPEATVVGATRWFKGTGNGPTERLASYSNTGAHVDIWATGSVDVYKDGKGVDTYGTSFSAPRVAATMAALHKANPKMSSSQIEHLMKTKLTHQLDTPQGSVPVLDYHKSSDFMVGRGTY